MLNKNIIFTLLSILGLNGCFSSHYYVLSTASDPQKTYHHSKSSIGVEKVSVPEYLFKREIAIAKSNSEVSFLSDGTWAEDLNAGLTLRLVSFLQKKYNHPNVHEYPWGFDAQPSQKVTVNISRFIALDNKVYLDATWKVQNMKTGRTKAKIFTTAVDVSSGTTTDIVNAMDKAFALLEEDIKI